jgi:FkbM family methyltransferase
MRFHEKIFAEQYDRRLSDEGYPGNIAAHIIKELSGAVRVFDVGAGTGFIALPLAENGFQVKAIDPSKEMLSILERKIEGRNLNLKIINESWESFVDEPADAIISVHSIYPMKDPNYAISKMMRNADKSVIVIRKSVQDESVSDIIRYRFDKKRCSQIADEDVKSILKNAKISFKAYDIIQTRLSRFNDINDEIEYYISHFGLTDDNIKEISDIILSKTEKSENDFFYRTVYKDCMIVF